MKGSEARPVPREARRRAPWRPFPSFPVPFLPWVLVLLPLCLVPSWGKGSKGAPGLQEEPEKHLAAARTAFEEGRYDEALALAKRAEEGAPHRPEVLFLLGRIYLAQATGIRELTGFAGYFRRDLLGEAEEYFRKALQVTPKNGEIRNHLAFTLVLLRNLPAARDQARAVLKEDPENGYALYLLGEIDLMEGEGAAAAERFEAALAADPNRIEAREGLVRALTVTGRRAEAEAALIDLARAAPGAPSILNLAYGIYEPVELLEDAARLYERLVAILPDRVDLRFQLGTVYYRLGRFVRAAACFTQVLAREPDHEGALYYRGLEALRKKHYTQAADSFRRAAAREGRFFGPALDGLHRVALTLAGAGDVDGALRLFDELLALNPSDDTVLFNKALTLSRAGMTEQADAAFRALMDRDPWNSDYVNNYALHLMGSGRTDRALAMLERAASMDGNLDALENLGAFYFYRAGQPKKADSYFLRVLASDPQRTKALVLHERIQCRPDQGD